MPVAPLFIIAKTGNSLPVYTLWLIYLLEYYTVMNMNELPIQAATWMNFKTILSINT